MGNRLFKGVNQHRIRRKKIEFTELPDEMIGEVAARLDSASFAHFAFVNKKLYLHFSMDFPTLKKYSRAAAKNGYLHYLAKLPEKWRAKISPKCSYDAYENGHWDILAFVWQASNSEIF